MSLNLELKSDVGCRGAAVTPACYRLGLIPGCVRGGPCDVHNDAAGRTQPPEWNGPLVLLHPRLLLPPG